MNDLRIKNTDPEVFRKRLRKIESEIDDLRTDKEELEKKIETHQEYWNPENREPAFECYICGGDQNIEAHHIVPNGAHGGLGRHFEETITLCRRCHRTLHGKYRQGIQFDESPMQEKERIKELVEKKKEYQFVLQAIGLIDEMREERREDISQKGESGGE